MNVKERAKEIRDLVSERRKASCEARAERQILTTRVGVYDKLLTRELLPALRTAIVARNAQKTEALVAQIGKTEAAREASAVRALNYAKTEALANVLTRNARTQLNTLSLATAAAQAGNPAAAKVLLAASKEVGANSTKLKKIRVKQIAAFTKRTAEQKNLLATAVAREAQVKIAVLAKQPMTAAVAQRLSTEKARLAIAKKVVAATPRPISSGLGSYGGLGADAIRTDNRINPATGQAAGRLISDWSSQNAYVGNATISGAALALYNKEVAKNPKVRTGESYFQVARSPDLVAAGKAPLLRINYAIATKTIKIVAGRMGTALETLGAAVEKVGGAVKDLLKKGACLITSNPAVMEAAASAAAGAAAGPVGAKAAQTEQGKAATKAVTDKLRSAAGCGGGGAATGAADAPSTDAPKVPEKKSFLPIVAAGGGAAALLFLLL